MDRESWRAAVDGVAKSWIRLSDWATELKGSRWEIRGITEPERTTELNKGAFEERRQASLTSPSVPLSSIQRPGGARAHAQVETPAGGGGSKVRADSPAHASTEPARLRARLTRPARGGSLRAPKHPASPQSSAPRQDSLRVPGNPAASHQPPPAASRCPRPCEGPVTPDQRPVLGSSD